MAMNHQPSRGKHGLLLISLVLGVISLDIPYIAKHLNSTLFIYGLKPLLWIGIAAIVCFLPRVRPKAKLRHRQFLNWWAFNFAVVFIAVSFLAGLIDGLGKSPYSHSLQGILLNILVFGSALVAREVVRNYLVNSFAKDENYFRFGIVAIVITIATIPIGQIFNLKGYEDTIKFIAQYFAPELGHNVFATYLAFLGGPLPGIIYMGTIKAVQWLSPILPSLQWITTALVGVLVPIFSLSIMPNIYLSEARLLKKSEQNGENPLGWIMTTIFSIGIVWFAVGVFPLYPSVIATGSMEPLIKPGDVILVQKVTNMEDIDLLRENDVIQFKRNELLISHRIIDIIEEDGKKSYRTKGDNNSGEDVELVKPEQIKGEIIKVVPKVGWPTLLMKSDKDINLEEIVF